MAADSPDFLAARFEENRTRLRSVAYRMLGSPSEAEDAVQEAWLRLSRADMSGVENLSGWLTTVVARVCLDMLRSRKSRREDQLDIDAAEPVATDDTSLDPEHEALLADSVGPALLLVLDTLTPAERLAFVLHDMFAISFDEIARIAGRSPLAARQLASRARRRVQGASAAPDIDRTRQRKIVEAFLDASRRGDFEALLAVLDPDVVLRADSAAIATGASQEVRGAHPVARTFAGRARAARAALIDGAPGAVWTSGGQPRVVFRFTIVDETIVGIELVADPARIGQLESGRSRELTSVSLTSRCPCATRRGAAVTGLELGGPLDVPAWSSRVDAPADRGDHHGQRAARDAPNLLAVVDNHQPLFENDSGTGLGDGDRRAVLSDLVRPEPRSVGAHAVDRPLHVVDLREAPFAVVGSNHDANHRLGRLHRAGCDGPRPLNLDPCTSL